MKQINQKIEKLIVRSLDGALTEQEQLELNRELIRNPDARQIMEQYQRIDNVAIEALDQVIGQTDDKDDDPNDSDYSSFAGCKCEHNAACLALDDYISIPTFMRQSMKDMQIAPASMKGLY